MEIMIEIIIEYLHGFVVNILSLIVLFVLIPIGIIITPFEYGVLYIIYLTKYQKLGMFNLFLDYIKYEFIVYKIGEYLFDKIGRI